MSLQIGIVGLPNVGKSTLFNALTRTQSAQAANYPFCTIDPNVGVVEVPDERLKKLAEVVNPARIVPAIIEFVDIAGLVKGASQGEGLGNQFLSHIRECDAIAQVVRFFEDTNITHVHDQIDPKRDAEIIFTELILADLQTVTRTLEKARSNSKSGKKEDKEYLAVIEKIFSLLDQGKPARIAAWEKPEMEVIKNLHLLTMKPVMFIANIREDETKNFNIQSMKEKLGLSSDEVLIPICAKVEADLAGFSEQEAGEYLKELGLKETGLKSLIRSAYDLLGLHTYFTAGPKEVRAWTIHQGDLAPQAAGVIHTDFEKGFIRADVYNWTQLVELKSETKIREKGLLRSEGKNYVVQDGDVMHFHFN